MIAIQAKNWDAEPGEENVVILANDFADIADFLKSSAGDNIDGVRTLYVIDIRGTKSDYVQEIDLETAAKIRETASTGEESE